MPTMFGSSRNRATAQPLTRETADPNAATAAASAFVRKGSNASLSSAAAAAALKARPTSPTNVADVQSKRLLRRSPSVSSAAGRDTSRRRELSRTPSVGSMMERTFRSPSPGRSPAPRQRDVPPVPSLPNTENFVSSSTNTSGQRKSSTLQTQNFRTASEKMKDGQRRSWFGAATARDPASVRRTSSALQLSSQQSLELRPGSVSPSINFSYPRARMQSPSGSVRSLQTDDRTLVYDANSRRMVPRGDLIARSQSMRESADDLQLRPKKKKNRTPQGLDRAGSHLSKGTVGRTQAPALDDVDTHVDTDREINIASASAPAAPEQRRTKTKMKRPKLLASEAVPGQDRESAVSASAQVPDKSLRDDAQAKSPGKAALEKEEDNTESFAVLRREADSHVVTPDKANGKAKSSKSKTNGKSPEPRLHSESPARSARFAASADQLVVRHEPPPRSLSPRKSAMKHASPTRAVTPSDDGSEMSAPALGSSLNDEAARRKSARVSWDDRNTVVVSEPSPHQKPVAGTALMNSQPNKPRLNTGGKNNKEDAVPVEEEETMSPRPVLPNFGSVREKKPRDQEERPLVRPQEHTSVLPLTADGEEDNSEPAHSGDSQNGAPTQPVLSSTERDEISSSDGSLMDDTTDNDAESDQFDDQETGRNAADRRQHDAVDDNFNDNVPSISISQPSPRPMDEAEESQTEKPAMVPPGIESDSDTDESDSDGNADLLAPGSHMDDIVEEEEEEEGEDLYSDAYEDISEVDGDGFMSLDAVLESPTSSPTAKNATYPSTQQSNAIKDEAEYADRDAMPPANDWENAKAYWKSLSLEKRRQLEKEAEAETSHETLESKLPGKKKDADPRPATPEQSEQKNGRVYQIKPGTKLAHDALPEVERAPPTETNSKPSNSKLRHSLRKDQGNLASDASQPVVGMRKSMRSDRPMSSGSAEDMMQRRIEPPSPRTPIGNGIKKSLRQSPMDSETTERWPSVTTMGRPASYHPMASDPVSGAHKRNRSADTALPSSPAGFGSMKSTLRRRGSDSSESSFTRMRSASGGAKEFRKSMRGSMREIPVAEETNQNKRFSLRPSSPMEMNSRRNSVSSLPAPGGMSRMRQSLRGESLDRNSRKRMSAFSKPPGTKGKKPKKTSRFVDSSDEDEEPSVFRSRFADSSSDDDERPTSKGRGLPKSLRVKSNNGATASAVDLVPPRGGFESPTFSELEDSLSQPKRSKAGAGASSLQRSGSGRGAILPLPAPAFANEAGDSSYRPSSSRRGSFMSILRRKKDASAKVSRPELAESAARRDTPLERTTGELELVRSNNAEDAATSWPLPGAENGRVSEDTTGNADIERPSTAGGPIRKPNQKTKFLRRRSASQGTTPAGPDLFAQSASPQKKKKFGALRKMFGLND